MLERVWREKQTRLKIFSDREEGIKKVIGRAEEVRERISETVERFPEFRESLEPVDLDPENFSGVVKSMLEASRIAHVGPFASVAGGISHVCVRSGLKACDSILVDNGGDIVASGDEEFQVGVFAGESEGSGRFSLLLDKDVLPLSVCTSSGTVGHSMSFGQADAVVVVGENGAVCDAVATRVCNEVVGNDVESSVKKGLDLLDDFDVVDGGLVIRERMVGRVGNLPELFSLPENDRAFPDVLSEGFDVFE